MFQGIGGGRFALQNRLQAVATAGTGNLFDQAGAWILGGNWVDEGGGVFFNADDAGSDFLSKDMSGIVDDNVDYTISFTNDDRIAGAIRITVNAQGGTGSFNTLGDHEDTAQGAGSNLCGIKTNGIGEGLRVSNLVMVKA